MTTNTPDFVVYGVTQQAGKKDILTRIGAGWKHQRGDGVNLQNPGAAAEFRWEDRALPAEGGRRGRSAGRRRRRTVLSQAKAARLRAGGLPFNLPAGDVQNPPPSEIVHSK